MAADRRPNPLVALGVPQSEIDKAIRTSAEAKAEKARVGKEMAAHAKSISPVDHGDYGAAWKVQQGKGRDDDTKVINDNFKAHWIEDGTGAPARHRSSPSRPAPPSRSAAPPPMSSTGPTDDRRAA
ncbi:hypothetical protein I540_4710 [Mycobacteroides abscessus subsp. bolletii 1513]|uniref:Uncharacterized protein n=1 Tax=Mycobacteroides abscessus subsp. bolletii 1513 TaxID=1299321 RepID=X8DK57_9MYCO|nr:hypothetical protein I540_4710 [Mycobacteroides abscessus subsp. bolletii 1513]